MLRDISDMGSDFDDSDRMTPVNRDKKKGMSKFL